MAAREDVSSFQGTSGDHPDSECSRAPIRQTLVGELDGLFRFAMARVGQDTHVAEDVVQQALLIAMAHASPPSEVHVQRAWLRGVVRNVIRHHVRSSRRGREAVNRAAIERHDAPRASSDGGPQRDDESRGRIVRALFLAVTELDQADQDLFYAFYRAGLSHASIGAALGTTAKGVEARLYRLRSRLRAALDRCADSIL